MSRFAVARWIRAFMHMLVRMLAAAAMAFAPPPPKPFRHEDRVVQVEKRR